ncbi:protein-disulfide reductase DsbD family protein [Thermodesulfobacteriota bacterium]
MQRLIARFIHCLILIFILLSAPASLTGATLKFDTTSPEKASSKKITVRSVWSVDRAHAGDSAVLAIVVNIPEGLHINANAEQIVPFEDFKPYPTRIKILEAADGMTIALPLYPPARAVKVSYGSGSLMSFEGETIFYLPVKLDEHLKPGASGLKVMVEYQACDATTCFYPEKVFLETALEIAGQNTPVVKSNEALFASYDEFKTTTVSDAVLFDLFGRKFSIDISSWTGFILLLFTAAFGGMLLNFTPCVLPIIPIKIISLSNAAENRKRCFALGFAMVLGVLAFWIGLGVMIALVSEFTATNQLFQYPAFTISVGIIIAVMALGMCGLYNVRLPNFIYMINPSQESLHGSFALGILTAVLSTPCTAPFMGAAAAWAATRHPFTTLTTFAAIGTGMALPYLILSASPGLVKKMPRTGPASVLIKEVMGLFMLGAAAYFIGGGLSALLASPPNPPSKIYWWSVAIFCAAAGGWLAYRTVRITARKGLRALFVALGILIIAGSATAGLRLTDKGPIDWVYYTPERFEEAVRQKKIVVLDFTAEWCLNCKALEAGVLHNRRLVNLFSHEDIIPIKVDITGKNVQGKAKLKAVGKLTIPLLVIYDPNGREVFKSDFYTADQVLQVVENIRKKKN